jgi:glycosyltransferase involved in cell wall biosynthesis
LIIVNDGSTDDTRDVVKSIVDDRIISVENERNRGMLATRNVGFNLARGKYIALLDDDDELMPGALQTAVCKLKDLSAEGIKMVWFAALDPVKGYLTNYGRNSSGYITYEDALCVRVHGDFWAIFAKDLLGDDRFDERGWGMESALFLKLHRRSKVYYFHEPLVLNHHEHAGRAGSSKTRLLHLPESALAIRLFLKQYGAELASACPERYGYLMASLGFLEIMTGNLEDGRNDLRKSFKYTFRWRMVPAYLVALFMPERVVRTLYSTLVRLR